MDGEVTESSGETQPETITPSEKTQTYAETLRYFAQLFLHIGMTRDEYWNQDVYIVEEYLGAYKLSREEKNWQSWLNGIYTFDAVSAVIGNIHFDKGSHKVVKPMDRPLQIFPDTPDEVERKKQIQINKIVASLNRFHTIMESKSNAE